MSYAEKSAQEREESWQRSQRDYGERQVKWAESQSEWRTAPDSTPTAEELRMQREQQNSFDQALRDVGIPRITQLSVSYPPSLDSIVMLREHVVKRHNLSADQISTLLGRLLAERRSAERRIRYLGKIIDRETVWEDSKERMPLGKFFLFLENAVFPIVFIAVAACGLAWLLYYYPSTDRLSELVFSVILGVGVGTYSISVFVLFPIYVTHLILCRTWMFFFSGRVSSHVANNPEKFPPRKNDSRRLK